MVVSLVVMVTAAMGSVAAEAMVVVVVVVMVMVLADEAIGAVV